KKLAMDELHDIPQKCNGYVSLLKMKRTAIKRYSLSTSYGLKYQSLHTVVIGEGSVPLEVEIRTKSMHSQAEFGFANTLHLCLLMV
ncbi:probable GTP diphosphokinase RSH2, chloroplastic, partial [Tanacetum coccineum]